VGLSSRQVAIVNKETAEPLRVDLDTMPLCAALGFNGVGLLVGTENGCLVGIEPDGSTGTLIRVDRGWMEQVSVHAGTGVGACSSGRRITLLDHRAQIIAEFEDHPSTVTGLAFSPDGDRLAASHYDGVSVWEIRSGNKVESLYWHGSHTAVSWSPNGKYILSALQDNQLHAWRMPGGKSLKMSGYPGKIRSLSWTSDSAYAACSGADTVTSWYFENDGPGGTAPSEFGYVFNSMVTVVAAHPSERVVAGGYDNGTVLVGDVSTGEAMIARPAGGGKITGLSWTPGDQTLLGVTDAGTLAIMRFTGFPWN
jgi:WD40 repeat protein